MPKPDGYEAEVLSAYEKSELTSVADKEELARFRAIALHKYVSGRLVERPQPDAEVEGERERKRPSGVKRAS